MIEASKPFDDMSARIKRNVPEEFGGAFLIVSPTGEVVSYAAFDPSPDEASFWALVGSAVQNAIAEFHVREQGATKGFALPQRR